MDRRDSFRIKQSSPVELKLKDKVDTQPLLGRLYNISQTGAFLTFDMPCQIIGKTLTIKIHLGEKYPPFISDVNIAWKEKTDDKIKGMGLQFVDVNDEERQRLSLYLKQKQPAYYKEFQKITEIRHPGFRLNDKEKASLDILNTLRLNGCISKAFISQETNLNIVTLTNYLNNFIKKGLVLERGLDVSSGGRRPVLVELNSQYGYVIGIDLNTCGPYINSILIDLASKVVHKRKVQIESKVSGSLFANSFIERFILDFLKDVKVERSRIFAVGIGTFGLNNNHSEIKRVFEKNIKLPVVIENNYVAALFAEKWLNFARPDIRNMLYFGLEDTVSSLWGEDLFLSKGRQAITDKKEGINGNVCWLNDNCIFKLKPIKMPFRLQEEDELVLKLSAKIAYLVNVINPDAVVLGGGLEQFSPNLISRLKEKVKTWTFDYISPRLKIVPARLGEDAVALGAGSLAIRDFFTQI